MAQENVAGVIKCDHLDFCAPKVKTDSHYTLPMMVKPPEAGDNGDTPPLPAGRVCAERGKRVYDLYTWVMPKGHPRIFGNDR